MNGPKLTNWQNMIIRLGKKKVGCRRINAETRFREWQKIGHMLHTPAIVKKDGTRIKPVMRRSK